MKNKNKWIIGITVATTLVVASIASYIYFQNNQKLFAENENLSTIQIDQSTSSTSSASPSPSPLASALPNSVPDSWVKTSDEVAGYEISHPSDLKLFRMVRLNEDSQLFAFSRDDQEFKVSISRYLPNSTAVPDPSSVDQLKNIESISVGGEPAFRRVTDSQEITVRFAHNNSQYILTATPANSQFVDTFDQMISSFKFIPAVTVESPRPQQEVTSPIQIEGTAPGTWFFEGNLPARLVTTKGKELGRVALTTSSDWMTEQEIPFSGELKFSKPATTEPLDLIISKANPSGLPENDRELRIAVVAK